MCRYAVRWGRVPSTCNTILALELLQKQEKKRKIEGNFCWWGRDRRRAGRARPQCVKKHRLCYIENVGATMGRPPAWRSNALSGMAFLQGIRARASNARPYRSFSTVWVRACQDPTERQKSVDTKAAAGRRGRRPLQSDDRRAAARKRLTRIMQKCLIPPASFYTSPRRSGRWPACARSRAGGSPR